MSTRTRKQEKLYLKKLSNLRAANVGCPFCGISDHDDRIQHHTESFQVMRNEFGYSLWDNLNVEQHIMIIPRFHATSIASFTQTQAIEFMQILSSYEQKGYSIWARSPGSVTKSVAHQHTHLIKLGNKPKNFILFLQKPYLLLHR